MKIVNCKQGSKEWLEARAGVITASMFKDARAVLKSGPKKGMPTKKADDYAFHLACERINEGLLEDDQFITWQMKRGNILESEARIAHENHKGILVQECGFIHTNDKVFGSSLDGLIDDDGACEYKCFVAPSSIKPIILDENLDSVIDQVQGGMWISGRKYFDFCLYCPQLKKMGRDITVIHVERNEEYIEELEQDMLRFNALVEDYTDRLLNSNKTG